ncbi:dihydrofolate reductase family protein [Nocardiopsis sp. CNT312]|uniref:dihydrofolate reductase family protein n=1 Tax=Nocardiopsis sp. CNT312 TaxID=1137268 RepID=UPI0004B690D1|nr:dihydrofolate reductase family protein [Nocardiopsis sp. CNT312]
MVSDNAPPVRFRELLPRPGAGEADPATAYAYPDLLERPWIRANMVASADGGAVGPSGGSRDLSSAADRRLLGTLRGLCDVLLVGARTARSEGYRALRARRAWEPLRRGRPPAPPTAVVSRSLDLPEGLLEAAPEGQRTIVLTVAGAPAERLARVRRHADVVVVEGLSVGPEHIVDALGERGLYRVLTEGGPHLLAEFVSAGLLDELCLTTSPHLLGSGSSRVVAGGPGTPGAPERASVRCRPVRLAGLLESDGTLFARYVRDPGDT